MEDEFFEDLLNACQDVIERNPGINFETWVDFLVREYPAEVVDALGSNPDKIHSSLEEIWNTHLEAL